MSDNVEVAKAFVTIIPSMQGAQKTITDELVPATSSAGAKAGAEGGKTTGLQFAGSMGTVVKGLAAGWTASKLFGGLMDIGSEFDDLSDSISVATGKSGKDLDALTDTAREMMTEIPVSLSDAGDAVTSVSQRLGLTGDNLKTVAEQIAEVGRMTGEAVDLDSATGAMNAFGISQDKVSSEMDALFAVTQNTGIGFNDLLSTVQQNAATMTNLGFSMDQTASLAGLLDKAGLDANSTMASMSKGLVTMAKSGEKPASTFKRVTGQIQSLVSKGKTAEAINLASGIFGTRGATKFVAAVQSGAMNLDDLTSATQSASGGILETAESTNDWAEKWQILKAKFTEFIEPLASGVFSSASIGMDALGDSLDWLSKNSDIAIPIIAGLGAILVASLAPALWGVVTAMWATTTAMLANPVTWIIMAIGLLVAGLVVLAMNWSSIWSGMRSVGQSVGDWFTDLWQGITDWFTDLWQGASDWWTGLWNGLKGNLLVILQAIGAFIIGGPIASAFVVLFQKNQAFHDWVVGLWTGLMSWFTSAWNAVASWWTGLWSGIGATATAIGSRFRSLWASIMSWFTGRWSVVASSMGSAWSRISGFFTSAAGTVRGVWSSATSFFLGIPGRITSVFRGLASSMSSPFLSAFGLIRSTWNAAIGGFGFTVPSWIPKVGGKSFKIPYLATGGTLVSGGSVVVGEAGPELLTLPSGATVTPLSGANAATGGDIVIPIYLGGQRLDELVVTAQQRANYRSGGR